MPFSGPPQRVLSGECSLCRTNELGPLSLFGGRWHFGDNEADLLRRPRIGLRQLRIVLGARPRRASCNCSSRECKEINVEAEECSPDTGNQATYLQSNGHRDPGSAPLGIPIRLLSIPAKLIIDAPRPIRGLANLKRRLPKRDHPISDLRIRSRHNRIQSLQIRQDFPHPGYEKTPRGRFAVPILRKLPTADRVLPCQGLDRLRASPSVIPPTIRLLPDQPAAGQQGDEEGGRGGGGKVVDPAPLHRNESKPGSKHSAPEPDLDRQEYPSLSVGGTLTQGLTERRKIRLA